jgi:class 3 adenylate cyclase
MEATNKQFTLLFADVSGSTGLYESLGDAAAFREVRGCLTVFERVVAAYDGRVVKTLGDGSMCVFREADAAVLAACEMQSRVQDRNPLADRKIEIRIGLHQGPVLQVEQNDLYGDTVNMASRMAEFAAGGQILTTRSTVVALSPELRAMTRRLDKLPVKGKQQEVELHEVLWQVSDLTQMPGHVEPVVRYPDMARLRIKHGEQELVIVTTISIGRHLNNGIVLRDPMASRHHAFIERRHDRFVLTDQSTNGTFVKLENGEEFQLRRESMILYGTGLVSCGHECRSQDGDVLAFVCETSAEALEAVAVEVTQH